MQTNVFHKEEAVKNDEEVKSEEVPTSTANRTISLQIKQHPEESCFVSGIDRKIRTKAA